LLIRQIIFATKYGVLIFTLPYWFEGIEMVFPLFSADRNYNGHFDYH